MRSWMAVVALVLCAGLLAGCNGVSYNSMNTQRAALRDAADISGTLAFDNVSDANIDKVLTDTKEVAEAVIRFLDSGNVADLPMARLQAELAKIVPVQYQGWVSLALSYAGQYSVDPGRIGNKTVRHLKEFFFGVTLATGRYDKADRTDTRTKDMRTLEVDQAAYNATLLKQMKK